MAQLPQTPPHVPDDPPCTAHSHASGNFFDLSPLVRAYPADTADWAVRGHDYPANFTLNVCAPLLQPLPQALLQAQYPNVSAAAHFADGRGVVPIGTASAKPKFRGRSLVLEYTGGAPCLLPDGTDTGLTASTLISFKCAHADGPGGVAFVGSLDNCTYFFEARTLHACPAVDRSQGTHPATVFVGILLVAVGVYMVAAMMMHPGLAWKRVRSGVASRLRGLEKGGELV